MILFRNVSKKFGDQVVLDKVNFAINKGEKVGIVGENGAGKTTLLRAIIGELDFHGSVDTQGQSIAFLAQSPRLKLQN